MRLSATNPTARHDVAAGHLLACVMAALSGLARGRSGSRRGDHGATAVEYALMASLIALVIVVSVTLFGQNVITLFAVPTSVFNP